MSIQDEIYYVFTYVSSFCYVSPLLTWKKELGSLGKCNCDIECDMRVNADKDSRYANTLMVSLNNRIYFREHALSVVHSSSNHIVDSQHGLEVTSHHFHQVGAPPRATTIGNGFKLDTLSSHTVELARVKGDGVSVNSEQ
jgi:hypothetical protein